MDETLVLIPGMMCDARLFAPQIAEFSARHPVMIIPPVGAKTIPGLARNLLGLAPPTFALAGLSMGGILAMEVIRQAPERITRLALMDTNPFADAPEKAPIREAQISKVAAGGLREVMRDEMIPHYPARGSDDGSLTGLCLDMADALGPGVFIDQSEALKTRPDQYPMLASVTVPTLVLCGEDDRLCPVGRHKQMHDQITGSRLEIITGAGHLPTLEQAGPTNKVLREWLRA